MCDDISNQQEIMRRANVAREAMVSDEISRDIVSKDIYVPDLDCGDEYKEPVTLDVTMLYKFAILIGFLVLLWLVGDM